MNPIENKDMSDSRKTYTKEEKAKLIEKLDGDYTAKNLNLIATEADILAQNLRNWCVAAGHITPKTRSANTAPKTTAPKLITSAMRTAFDKKMKPHAAKEKALENIKKDMETTRVDLQKFEDDYNAKEKELLDIQIEIQKEIGMI